MLTYAQRPLPLATGHDGYPLTKRDRLRVLSTVRKDRRRVSYRKNQERSFRKDHRSVCLAMGEKKDGDDRRTFQKLAGAGCTD